MSLHLCASVPNVRIMELRPDEAPWTKEFVTHPTEMRDGCLSVPVRPGWGADVNEGSVARTSGSRPLAAPPFTGKLR